MPGCGCCEPGEVGDKLTQQTKELETRNKHMRESRIARHEFRKMAMDQPQVKQPQFTQVTQQFTRLAQQFTQ